MLTGPLNKIAKKESIGFSNKGAIADFVRRNFGDDGGELHGLWKEEEMMKGDGESR